MANSKETSYAAMEKRMQTILDKLTDENLSLDEQLKLGEEGEKLLQVMGKRLAELQKKVAGLSKIKD